MDIHRKNGFAPSPLCNLTVPLFLNLHLKLLLKKNVKPKTVKTKEKRSHLRKRGPKTEKKIKNE